MNLPNLLIQNDTLQLTWSNKNDRFTLHVIGIYLIIVFVLSNVSNLTLLWIFYVNKKLRSPTDIYIISLACNNVFGSFTALPFIIISNFTLG